MNDELQTKLDEIKDKYATLERKLKALITDSERLQKRMMAWRLKGQGYSNAEIAKQVGLSENSVRVLLKPNRRKKEEGGN